MQYAVFSDAHGHVNHIESVLAAADKYGVSDIISLGDIIDVKPPKQLKLPSRLPPADVADFIPEIASITARCLRLRGNQEERFLRMARVDEMTESDAALFRGPSEFKLNGFRFAHGHQFHWCHSNVELRYPNVMMHTEILFHGHRHRRQFLRRPKVGSSEGTYEQIEIVMCKPIRIRMHDQTLVDVGPLFVDGAWILLDIEDRTVTYFNAESTS